MSANLDFHLSVIDMSRFFILSFLLILVSCSEPKLNPAIVKDESTSPSQEELYLECSELKGIGNLIVGKTTLKQALKDPECNLFEGRVNFSSEGEWSIYNDKERKWVEKNHPELVRYRCSGPMGSLDNYKIGDYSLHDMYAVFYHGVLAAIAYDCASPELYDLIAAKYGSGRGDYHYYFQDNDPEVYPRYRRRYKVDIDKFWENEKVLMHYYYNLSQALGYSNAHIEEEHFCIISDKQLLPLYEQGIQDAIKEFHLAEEEEKDRTKSRI